MQGSRNRVFWVALVALVAGVSGFVAWTQNARSAMPPGIISANGWVVAKQVGFATKLAGRIVEVIPREGDMLEAQLRQVEADTQRAREAVVAAEAMVASRRAELTFVDQEVKRSAAVGLMARRMVTL